MKSTSSPFSHLPYSISICIAFTVLSASAPNTIASLNLALPEMAQLMCDEMHNVFFVGELNRRQVAAMPVMEARIRHGIRAWDRNGYQRSVTLADIWFTQAAPDKAALIMRRAFIVGPSAEPTGAILERDIESRDIGWTAETDDLSQLPVWNLSEVLKSHFRLPFRESFTSAPTYRVPASKQNSLRLRSSRMPITPRGYSVITRLGFTP